MVFNKMFSQNFPPLCGMHIKYKSLFWMRDHSTSWIMAEDTSVENKVFITNFNHLVYTSWWQLQGF